MFLLNITAANDFTSELNSTIYTLNTSIAYKIIGFLPYYKIVTR